MSPRVGRDAALARAVLLGSLALLGCPDKSSQPPGDERLLAKLKAEKAREEKEGPTVAPTAVEPVPQDQAVNPLAEFAAKGTQKRELKVPAQNNLQLGKNTLRLSALEATHTVGTGVSVTTDDWFVVATFDVVGPEGGEVDLSAAHLERDGKAYPLARDAQAAAHQKPRSTLTKDGARVELYFEVPAADGLGKGLSLVVPDGEHASRLEL